MKKIDSKLINAMMQRNVYTIVCELDKMKTFKLGIFVNKKDVRGDIHTMSDDELVIMSNILNAFNNQITNELQRRDLLPSDAEMEREYYERKKNIN